MMALVPGGAVVERQDDGSWTNAGDSHGGSDIRSITITTTIPADTAAGAAAQPVTSTLTTVTTIFPNSVASSPTWAISTNIGTPSTSTPTSRSTHETSSPSATPAGGTISPAEAGGIAVGAAVGGVVLALLAVVGYIRLKRHRRDRKPSFAFAAGEDKALHRDASILDHLPQGVADETFRQKLRKLSTDIKNCVDSFFTEEHLQLDASTEASLQSFAGPPIHGSSWSAACLNDKTRSRVIRLLIAQIIFKSIHPLHYTDICLLPHELLALYQVFQKAPETSRSESGFGSDTPNRKELLALWRQISGHMFPAELRTKQNHLDVSKIVSALAPLHPKPYNSFYRIIEGIVQDAGQLGLELFADAHEWEPIWTKSHKDVNGAMVVFPGLQVSRKRTVGEHHHGDREVKVAVASCIAES